MTKRNLNRFNFEQLENRRLLAADCCAAALGAEMLPAELCMVGTTEEVVESEAAIDFNETEICVDSPIPDQSVESELPTPDGAEPATDIDPVNVENDSPLDEPEVDAGSELTIPDVEIIGQVEVESSIEECDVPIPAEGDAAETPTAEVGDVIETIDNESELEEELVVDPQPEQEEQEVLDNAVELRDPVVGPSGYFGELTADATSKSMAFTPTETGTIDLVMASSFESSNIQIEVNDADGNPVEPTEAQQVDGFQVLTFDVSGDQTYHVSVSSDQPCDGHFMVTIDFEPTPVPVDLHANEMSEDSTLLDFVDGEATLSGELESVGDVDTFRFVSEGTGKANLNLVETIAETGTELNVSVVDEAGNEIVRGVTNESVTLSFDVNQGAEYFVAIEAAAEQVGEYKLALELDIEISDPQPIDQHANEVGADATPLTFENGSASVASAIDSAEDRDAFRFVADSTGDVVVELATSSENHIGDARVSVHDPNGEMIVDGTTNEEVMIRFDSQLGVEYQILVDSLNDIPATYELTATAFAADPVAIDDLVGEPDVAPVNELTDSIEDSLVCQEDGETGDSDMVDDVFGELGADFSAGTQMLVGFDGRIDFSGFRWM